MFPCYSVGGWIGLRCRMWSWDRDIATSWVRMGTCLVASRMTLTGQSGRLKTCMVIYIYMCVYVFAGVDGHLMSDMYSTVHTYMDTMRD